jgi:protein phosphatase
VIVDVVDDDGRARSASAALADEPRTLGAARREQGSEELKPRPGTDITGVVRPVEARSREPRPRRLTWRVAVFVVALLLVFGFAGGAVWWYARNTFYVGIEGDDVAIFRGRPGGLLWFDPTLEERSDLAADDVPQAALEEIEDGREASNLAAARRYIDRLEERAAAPSTSTSTAGSASTTTTTATATTTSTQDGTAGP